MKIVIPTPIFPPEIGGPATYVSELAKRLSAEHEITIITFTQNPQPTKITKVIPISQHKHFLGILFRQLKLAAAIVKYAKNADIIYSQGPIVVGFTSAIVGKILGKPTMIKFVGDIAWEEAERIGETNAELEEFLKSGKTSIPVWIIQSLQKLTLQLTAKIVTPSSYIKNMLTTYYGVNASKIEVIPNAVEVKKLKKKKTSQKQLTIVSAGRLVRHKRFDLVIQAYAIVKEKIGKRNGKGVRLIIVGDGPMKQELEELIRGKELEKNIILTGSLSKSMFHQTLKDVDLFVLASEYEGLPHVIIEAMLLGVPVVVSDIPGNREVIVNGKTGLLVHPRPKKLEKAMLKGITGRNIKKASESNLGNTLL